MNPKIKHTSVTLIEIECDYDDTIVIDFLRWQLDNETFPVFTLVSGPGIYSGLFKNHDYLKANFWLKTRLMETSP